jgi:predicted short-subunit dehydrogenase-like oxidoreductase (DUF2520 family)
MPHSPHDSPPHGRFPHGDTPLGALGRVGLVGAGSLGSSLGRALAARGARVVAVASRTPARAVALAAQIPDCDAVATPAELVRRADTVFLAVPDDAIAAVAASIPWRAGHAGVHLSGAQGLEPLAVAAAAGARIAALHPLMTFPASMRAAPLPALLQRFAGCTWALEANDPALADALADVVRALGGRIVALASEDRVPYHAAAVLASNDIVALLGAAVRLWEGFGVAPEDALAALLPLTRAAVESLSTSGLPAALTGPVARGDLGTVAAHLAWLDERALAQADLVPLRDAYVALARLALPLARAKGGLSPEAADRLRALLDPTEENGTLK